MNNMSETPGTTLFTTINTARISNLIQSAKRFVCFAGPGIQQASAEAMVKVANRLGIEMVTVCLDFDEQAMRMGFGDMKAVETLRNAGLMVRDAPGIRTALVLVDDEGYIFTPTALYLEAEPKNQPVVNAMRLSKDQLKEALARLSPVANAIARAQASTDEERERIANLPVEVGTELVTEEQFTRVNQRLMEVPAVKFDIARQVRVFSAYLQYVELKLTGAAIQRNRLVIPPNVLKLGGSADLEGRLRTTFDLIEKGDKLSSKKLEAELNDIRSNFTPSLGKDHGRVMLKAQKRNFESRLVKLRNSLTAHQKKIADELQGQLDESREQIISYYLQMAIDNPPDAMLGQLTNEKPSEEDARRWLNYEMDQVFPMAESLIENMQLELRYKDVTFETLNQPDFKNSLKNAFPRVPWDKAYQEFLAAGEEEQKG